MEKSENKGENDEEKKVKDLENSEKKQSELLSKKPRDLDIEKRQLFARKVIFFALVILVCITTPVAWMVGPFVAFSSPQVVSFDCMTIITLIEQIQ